jgi:hypothetical protein
MVPLGTRTALEKMGRHEGDVVWCLKRTTRRREEEVKVIDDACAVFLDLLNHLHIDKINYIHG